MKVTGFSFIKNAMLDKRSAFVKLYHGDHPTETVLLQGDSYEYEKNVTELVAFEGNHPEVLRKRISLKNWKLNCDISFQKRSLK
jgi:hypothetical protein